MDGKQRAAGSMATSDLEGGGYSGDEPTWIEARAGALLKNTSHTGSIRGLSVGTRCACVLEQGTSHTGSIRGLSVGTHAPVFMSKAPGTQDPSEGCWLDPVGLPTHRWTGALLLWSKVTMWLSVGSRVPVFSNKAPACALLENTGTRDPTDNPFRWNGALLLLSKIHMW